MCITSPLTVNGDLTEVFTLPITHTFSGTVTDQNGNPLSGLSVTLTGASNASGCTNSSGHFSITVNAGSYAPGLTWNTSSQFCGTTTIFPGGNMSNFTLVGTNKVDLTGGDVTQNMQLSLATVTGIFKDATGTPIPNVQFIAKPEQGATNLFANEPATGNAQAVGLTDSTGTARLVMFEGLTFGQTHGATNTSDNLCVAPNSGVMCITSPLTVNGDLTEVFQEQPLVPPAPTNLTAVSPAQNPNLTWNAVTGSSSYNIYRNGANIGSVTTTSFTDYLAQEGTDTYFVTAVNSGGESPSSNIISVLVDRTAPIITYTLSPTPNADGWVNGPVTVTFVCNDNTGGSGIASCSSPITLSGKGANQTATGTAMDNAGNTSTITAAVNIDQTKPTITYAISPTPNSNGWNNSDVTVTFQCNDALSGIATCSAPITINTEGANQTVTGTAIDKAGNTVSVTVASINIDKTSPSISYTITPVANGAGWNKGDVTVTFNCSDNLSGIQSCTSPVTISTEGANQKVNGTAVDKAGNTSSVTATVNIDKTAPTITYSVSPAANANGWQNSNVTVIFTCVDALSGISSCSSPVTLSTEGASQTVTGTTTDNAGNTSSVTATVNIDKTAPQISYTLSSNVNSNGWSNTSPVTVTFNCSDVLSGIASCTAPVTISGDGAYVVTGTAIDNAGNTTSLNALVGIDTTQPTITASFSPAPNASGWNNSGPVTVSYTCSDDLSGIASCPAPQTESADGQYTLSGTAVDNAGNTTTILNQVNIDTTAPTIGTLTLSPNVMLVGSNTALTVPTTDNLSGVVGGEYFVGTDPGVGNGTAITTYGNGSLSTTFGSALTPGVYTVGVRSKDAAGNWSTTSTVMLTVYDSTTTLGVSGADRKGQLVPSTANGDVMPGLTSSSTAGADYGFTVQYKNGVLDPHNAFTFTYATGGHTFSMTATSFAWMTIGGTNNSQGWFQGTATVTVDGVTTTNPFYVAATDGDRTSPTTNDFLTLKVYAPGADPSTATAIYQASGSVVYNSGNGVKIH